MAVFTGINVGGETPEQITDALVELNRSLEYQMANISNENISQEYVYAGTVTANQINVGTLTGFTIQSGTSGNRVSLDQSGFHSYDSSGVQRIAILNNDNWGNVPNSTMYLFNESGASVGYMYAAGTTYVISSPSYMRFGSGSGISYSATIPYIDFENVPIRNFRGSATFS